MKFFNMRFALLAGAVIVATAVGAVIMPHDGQSQEKAAAPAAADENAWANRCEDLKEGEKVTGKYCEAFQRLSVMQKDADPKTAQRLAEFAIGYPPADKGKPRGVMILPLGIIVDEKVVIEIDGKESMKFAIHYCDQAGCVGLLELNAGLLDKMRKGQAMTVKTKANNGQPLQIGMSLKGLGDALDKAAKPKS